MCINVGRYSTGQMDTCYTIIITKSSRIIDAGRMHYTVEVTQSVDGIFTGRSSNSPGQNKGGKWYDVVVVFIDTNSRPQNVTNTLTSHGNDHITFGHSGEMICPEANSVHGIRACIFSSSLIYWFDSIQI